MVCREGEGRTGHKQKEHCEPECESDKKPHRAMKQRGCGGTANGVKITKRSRRVGGDPKKCLNFFEMTEEKRFPGERCPKIHFHSPLKKYEGVAVKGSAQGEIESVFQVAAGKIYNSNEGPASKKRRVKKRRWMEREEEVGKRVASEEHKLCFYWYIP